MDTLHAGGVWLGRRGPGFLIESCETVPIGAFRDWPIEQHAKLVDTILGFRCHPDVPLRMGILPAAPNISDSDSTASWRGIGVMAGRAVTPTAGRPPPVK